MKTQLNVPTRPRVQKLYTNNSGGYHVQVGDDGEDTTVVIDAPWSYSEERFIEDARAAAVGEWDWQEYADENPDDVRTYQEWMDDDWMDGEYLRTSDLPDIEAALIDGVLTIGRDQCAANGIT